MKRWLSVAILMVLLFLSCASAEEIDVSTLSYEELCILSQKVEIALFGMVLDDGVDIPIGTYIGGVDIPVGSYILTVTGEDFFVSFGTYKSENEKNDYVDRANFNTSGQQYKLTVTEGMIIWFMEIRTGGTINLKTMNSLFRK